jgi:hypothetical protein
MTLPTQLQQQGAGNGATSGQPVSGTATVVKQQQQQPPMVAKVLTSAQGQVISMESLLAHQKQHGTLPQGVHNSIVALSSLCVKIPTFPLLMLTELRPKSGLRGATFL